MNTEPTKGLGVLAKLRPWFTVPEAAKYLSVVFDTEISTADVLRFALDEKRKLSVRFGQGVWLAKHCPATPEMIRAMLDDMEQRRAVVAEARAAGVEIPPHTPAVVTPERMREREADEKIYWASNTVFDLPLLGAERLAFEDAYQRLTGDPESGPLRISAAVVEAEDGRRFQVMERFEEADLTLNPKFDHPDNFFPAEALGEGAVLVVRTSALRQLESAVNGDASAEVDAKPMGTRELSTLLALIAALAEEHSRIDISKPAQAAEKIEALTVHKGARVASRTILEHLKRVPDALERVSRTDVASRSCS